MRQYIILYSIAMMGLAITNFSCSHDSKKTESNNISPSDGDDARYNLSPQQEMSMQADTTKTDSLKTDSID